MHCTGGECPPFVTFGTAWSAQLLYTSGRIWARRRGPKPGSRQGQPVSSPRASEKYRELLMTVGRADANGAGSATGSAVTAKPDQQGAHATPPTTRAGQGSAASPGGTLSPVPMLPGQKAQGAQPPGPARSAPLRLAAIARAIDQLVAAKQQLSGNGEMVAQANLREAILG